MTMDEWDVPDNVKKFTRGALKHLQDNFLESLPPLGKEEDDDFYVQSPIQGKKS